MIASGVLCRKLIGRVPELRRLADATRHASDRQSALTVIRGEAGVGKTRLLTEFVAAAVAAGQRAIVTPIREYANAPYAAIVEALHALGVGDAFDAELQRTDHRDDKARLFANVARIIADTARTADPGVVLAFDDVQWADGATLELLRFLATRLSAEPVSLLAIYRADPGEVEPERLRALRALERDASETLSVEPLTGAEVDSLLHTALKGVNRTLPFQVLDQIRDISDGRPLFAEEILRSALERRDRDTGAVTVPPDLRAAFNERFALLSERDNDILLHAAVVGKHFSASFVTRLIKCSLTTVLGALRRARDLQIVEERQDKAGDAFAFRHGVIREALYAQLLRAEARAMHAHVAQLLANEEPLDVTAIAEHTWRARDVEHSIAWNERAGDAAAALFAYADAARHYGRACEMAFDDAQRASLAEKAAEALYATGEVGSAVELLSEAITALGEGEDANRLSIRKAYLLFDQGRYEECYNEARGVAGRLGDDSSPMRFYAEVSSAGFLVARGRAREALVHLEHADTCAIRGDAGIVARFEGNYAYCLAVLGRADEARERFENAQRTARTLNDYDILVRALNNHANMELSYGTVARARALYDDGLTCAYANKNLRFVAWLSQNSALAALIAGDLRAAAKRQSVVDAIRHDVDTVQRWALATSLRAATLGEGSDDSTIAAARAAASNTGDSADVLLAGALTLGLLRRDRATEAAALVNDAFAHRTDAEAPYWLHDAAARCGSPATRAAARAALATVAERDGAWPARGFLALADAREALRKRMRHETVRLAGEAVTAFRNAGWRVDEAFALELAGRTAEALALFREVGAVGEVRRIAETTTDGRRRRGDSTLTPREREIAALVADGRTSREIAQALVLSERTVETHIAAVYRKLGVTSRAGLMRLLDENAGGVAHR